MAAYFAASYGDTPLKSDLSFQSASEVALLPPHHDDGAFPDGSKPSRYQHARVAKG
jgi:hypothetical protein